MKEGIQIIHTLYSFIAQWGNVLDLWLEVEVNNYVMLFQIWKCENRLGNIWGCSTNFINYVMKIIHMKQ